MEIGALGKVYTNGEVIIQQGDKGDSIFVVQDGQVEVVKEVNGVCFQLAVLGKGDIFGEMATFDHSVRMATVRAMDTARILTIDQKVFIRRIHEDPSLAYHLLQVMSGRVRSLGDHVTRLGNTLPDQHSSPKPESHAREKFWAYCIRHLSLMLRPTTCNFKYLTMLE